MGGDRRSLERRLLELLAELAPGVRRGLLDQARAEVGYGEYGVALENLCENMFADDVRLSDQDIDAIAVLAGEMCLDPATWDFVRTLRQWPG